jgi:alanyl-tRNA synthetase
MSKTGNDIRREFISFFEEHQHRFVPSSSLLPADDPTLLFANAGMNQFKPLFLGTETRDYTRAANSQKCIRAGGKHNDLDDVGRDCYHHTFFEMLGNWSFGDYFKAESIDWAWDLLVNRWGLEPERLHATYFEGDAEEGLEPDTEARELWGKYLPADRIHPGNKKDNFWEMGDAGPCGPCSEIHYDATPDKSGGPQVNAGDSSVIEIWNLVFIQFNRAADGKLSPLPAKHVDTGMGLERVVRVIQGKRSNYATDLFTPILQEIETLSGHTYGQGDSADRYDAIDESNLTDVAMRVIADHIRALSFAIADGILPSNDGRGYVLRSILRRAAGFGRQYLGIGGTFLHKLVPIVVRTMGEAFAELSDRQTIVEKTILDEEETFAKTLDRGLQLLDKIISQVRDAGGKTIPGQEAFELHATYGFPIALTTLMAEKKGLAVDIPGFEGAMEQHRETSAAGGEKFKTDQVVGLPATDDTAKYQKQSVGADVLGWVRDGAYLTEGTLEEGAQAALVLDRTNFYGESGGQVGDTGTIMGDTGVFEVEDTQVAGQCVLHVGHVRRGTFQVGDRVNTSLCDCRMDTRRNHSATHLLNWALRRVLGESISQAGSVVDDQRLRFDFTHGTALTAEQLTEIEQLVNQAVLADCEVNIRVLPLAEAKEIPGVRAVFGEKYPDPVRVVMMGDATHPSEVSAEFCGGTHLDRTGQVGLFKILGEESVAKGVRRITAVTGRAAVEWVQSADAVLRQAGGMLKVGMDEIPARIEAMQKEIKQLRKKPAAASAPSDLKEIDTTVGKVVIGRAPADPAVMRNLCDQLRQKGAGAVFLGAADAEDGKVMLTAMVCDEWVKSTGLKAGDWVKTVAPIVGGGGGGKPTLAQAGGKQPEKLPDALAAAETFAKETLG